LEEVEEGEKEEIERIVEEAFEDLLREFIRKITLEGKRIDGRRPNEIRPTWCEVGILPRVHGSALFTRGETQSLGTCTLGTTRQDEQIIDQMLQEGRKRFMMHYNFPPYSVGETGRLGPPGRREIGHGHLAEEALKYVLPTEEEFPYIIRVVSEILESNGSSSMATVCSGSLALMDAGVPIKEPVAGIAMGLIKEGDRRVILTDIIGLEDKFGDMDFKVAGTENGVMAFQMDVKCGGIPYEVMEEAMKQAKNARLEILKMMEETLDRPRPKLSPYAPKLEVIKVDPDKVGLIIGPGGRMVRKIIDKTEVEIDIEDDGTVKISGIDKEGVKRAVEWIEELTEDLEVGRRYRGKVVRIEHYGAFVEIKEGIKGMVHISDLSDSYVKRVEDVVKVGDEITVEVIGIDEMGRPDLRRVPESQLQSKVKETKPKEKEDKPWIGDVVRGVVKNTTSFGAFVELDESGIIGLIHISDLAEDYVKQVEDVVKPGDRVLAQVIRIDKEGKYYLRRLTKEGIKFKLKA
jgi:polyribonucleotide nucleotidyltransferase